MKLSLTSLPLLALMSASLVAANPTPEAFAIEARDVCGGDQSSYTRRIGSPCAASNGVHEFCSCDRTNIVSFSRHPTLIGWLVGWLVGLLTCLFLIEQAKCSGGKWVDGDDCEKGGQVCVARDDGAQAQCL
jgi:hypothetical protein